ncbi:hypothetical protein ACWOFR_10760 [Carnobacterium gallinarum]|uniref:hypothetical protein n=1 Tax=Carnobacterium gallinarum TaxID=2749 RepID=UPI00068BB739|nr:hypothetical protein [Carnobacterium gallinarum]
MTILKHPPVTSMTEILTWLIGISFFLFIIGVLTYNGKTLRIPLRVSKNNPNKAKIQQQLKFARFIGLSSIWASVVTLLGSLSLIKVASDIVHTIFVSAFFFSILGPTIFLAQRQSK